MPKSATVPKASFLMFPSEKPAPNPRDENGVVRPNLASRLYDSPPCRPNRKFNDCVGHLTAQLPQHYNSLISASQTASATLPLDGRKHRETLIVRRCLWHRPAP